MEKKNAGDKIKLLLIDGDESMAYLIRRILSKEKYRIYTAQTGKVGMELAASICPDLIFMDVRLSDVDGLALLQKLRQWTDCPLVILSEEAGYSRKAEALYAGADDYIVKPFHEEELAARTYTVLRRRIPQGSPACYEAGELKIDFSRRQVSLSGNEVHFSPVEYRILECLALNAGTVVTYQMLLEKIWGPYASGSSRILRVNMTNIRKKIERVPTEPSYILTIPRVGYRMAEGCAASAI